MPGRVLLALVLPSPISISAIRRSQFEATDGALGERRGELEAILGTPAEEGGAGKEILYLAGAFEGVDCALMMHPAGFNLSAMPCICRADVTVDAALAWLDEHGDERFFLFLHTYEVHSPYTPPRTRGPSANIALPCP